MKTLAISFGAVLHKKTEQYLPHPPWYPGQGASAASGVCDAAAAAAAAAEQQQRTRTQSYFVFQPQ